MIRWALAGGAWLIATPFLIIGFAALLLFWVGMILLSLATAIVQALVEKAGGRVPWEDYYHDE